MEPDDVAAGLLDASLPQSEWTHAGHVAAAHALIRSHGHARALELLRTSIPRLNDAHGVPNSDDDGYHETLTVFFAAAVADAASRGLSAGETATAVPSAAPLVWWTRETLFSPAARHAWVPPDRGTPPFALLP